MKVWLMVGLLCVVFSVRGQGVERLYGALLRGSESNYKQRYTHLADSREGEFYLLTREWVVLAERAAEIILYRNVTHYADYRVAYVYVWNITPIGRKPLLVKLQEAVYVALNRMTRMGEITPEIREQILAEDQLLHLKKY